MLNRRFYQVLAGWFLSIGISVTVGVALESLMAAFMLVLWFLMLWIPGAVLAASPHKEARRKYYQDETKPNRPSFRLRRKK